MYEESIEEMHNLLSTNAQKSGEWLTLSEKWKELSLKFERFSKYEHDSPDLANECTQYSEEASIKASEKADKTDKNRIIIHRIVSLLFQTVVFAAFLYLLFGTDIMREASIGMRTNGKSADIFLFFSPLLFFALAIGAIGAIRLPKGKRYNSIFYIPAVIVQAIMFSTWTKEYFGPSYHFTDILSAMPVLLLIIVIPGAIVGMMSIKKVAVSTGILLAIICGGILYMADGSTTTREAKILVPAVAPEPMAIATPTPPPPLKAQDLPFVTTPEIIHINGWETSTYTDDFYLQDQLYSQGIGLYLQSRNLANDEIGISEVTIEVLEQYRYLTFELGADSKWGYDPNSGTFCVSVLGDNENELYYSDWQDSQFYDSVRVNISDYDIVALKLEEIKGSNGTLNIVFGNLMMSP